MPSSVFRQTRIEYAIAVLSADARRATASGLAALQTSLRETTAYVVSFNIALFADDKSVNSTGVSLL